MTNAAYEQWKRDRLAYVSGPTGNLALIDYHPVDEEPTEVSSMPISARRIVGEEGVYVTPLPGAELTVDGQPAVGETFLARLRPDGTPLARCPGLAADAFSLDGSDYELRIYDEAAPNRENFAGIDYYDYSPELVVTGHLNRHPDIELVPWEFTRESDTGHTKRIPGVLSVTVLGESRDLLAFLDSGNLVLVFADGTTGESYRPGRFLRMDPPGEDGVVEVDFNRSFVPPCGFSDFYSCPIPPAQNVFTVPIAGGEKKVLWKVPRY